jgi:prepilin-type N-terminal cleavage/methylation domain-containing protein
MTNVLTIRKSNTAAGFTLLELMIVITMIGVMTGVSAPYYLKERPARTTSNSAETLAQSMRLARFRAISLNRNVYVHFEPSGQKGFYTAYVNLGDPAKTPAGTAQEIAASKIEFTDQKGTWRGTALPTGVALSAGSATKSPEGAAVVGAIDLPFNPLVFEPRGSVRWPANSTTNYGTVYLSHSKYPQEVRAVSVSRTGHIKVWRLDKGVWK